MRFPDIHETAAYGNPEDYLERKQAREANAKKRAAENALDTPVARRPVLTVRKGWHARKAAEALFDFARGGAVSTVQSPALSASESRPGEDSRKNS